MLVGDNTWVIGAGNATVLNRGPTPSNYDSYEYDASQVECTGPISQSSHRLFTNSRYNCGNSGIVLANFTIDFTISGSQGPTPTNNGSATAIAFSAVEDTHIWNLHIEDAPQDAIFLRNGGVRTSVMHNVIKGFGLQWNHGAAIRVSMASDGSIGDRSNPAFDQRPPVKLFGNTILSRTTPGGNMVRGISISRPGPQPLGEPPRAQIQNNTIQLADGQTGIVCFDCVDSIIIGNIIDANPNDSDRTFTGIHVAGPGLRLLRNTITGSGVPDDGRGILVIAPLSNDLDHSDTVVIGNVVRNKDIRHATNGLALAALELRGISLFTVKNNRVENISNSPGIVIGHCSLANVPTPTSAGLVGSNEVTMADSQPGYAALRTSDTMFVGNLLNGVALTVDDIQLCHPAFNLTEELVVLP